MVRAPVDMFGEFDRWREPTLDRDAEVVSRGLGVFKVRRRSDDLAHVNPDNHHQMLVTISSLVKPGNTAVDAGANIGVITTFMSKLVGEQGCVIAIEMMPDTASMLRSTIALNDLRNVHVVERALSDRADETVVATVVPGLHGQASIVSARTGRQTTEAAVQTTTLDAVLADIEEIGIIKLDLEGAELAALKGAKDALKRVRAIVFESWAPNGGEVRDFLRSAGYQVQQIDGRNFLAVRED